MKLKTLSLAEDLFCDPDQPSEWAVKKILMCHYRIKAREAKVAILKIVELRKTADEDIDQLPF